MTLIYVAEAARAFTFLLILVAYCQKSEFLTITTNGHSAVSLGGLYSSIEEKFLPGMQLWETSVLEENMQTIYHPKERTFWTAAQTQEEKLDLLDFSITGSVGLALPAAVGTIKATGSFSYYQQERDFEFDDLAVLHYFTETRTDTINSNVLRYNYSYFSTNSKIYYIQSIISNLFVHI